MNNIITLKEAHEMYRQILKRYEDAELGRYIPDGMQKEWFSDTLQQLDMIASHYGNGTRFFLDEIAPNAIATQSSISKIKYDGLGGIIDTIEWEIFPVISIYVGGINAPKKYRFVASKGHTRNRVFIEGGKTKIPSFIVESKKAEEKAEKAINMNMEVMMRKGFPCTRHPRIKDIPLNDGWDNRGLILTPEDYINGASSSAISNSPNHTKVKTKKYIAPSWKYRNGD